MRHKSAATGRFECNDPLVAFNEKWELQTNGCWQWKGARTHYPNFSSKKLGFEGGISGHRAAWLLYKGDIPSGLFVLHHCDNKSCVNPDHLFLGTQSDNMQDKFAKNRQSNHLPPALIGEQNFSAKLTEDQVIDLRKKRNDGWTYEELGKKFNVSNTTAWRTATNKNWKHI